MERHAISLCAFILLGVLVAKADSEPMRDMTISGRLSQETEGSMAFGATVPQTAQQHWLVQWLNLPIFSTVLGGFLAALAGLSVSSYLDSKRQKIMAKYGQNIPTANKEQAAKV